MSFSRIRKSIKERFATSGLSPSYRIELLNLFLEFGKWLETHELRVTFETRCDLYQYINTEIVKNGPIDYLEFGVAHGKSMRDWVQLNQHEASRFFGFDTFEGLPEGWKVFTGPIAKGSYSAEGKIPEINDPRVNFIKGLFQATLPNFLEGFTVHNRLVINCDADLYTSTLYVLANLNYLIVPGTIVIFDEFSTMEEFRAFRDFTQSFRRDYEPVATAERFFLRTAIEFT
jgi:hypothetical protein